MRTDYARHIGALSDTELERFVDDWMNRKKKRYHAAERFSGSGDLGRDVVGYLTSRRHEGPWDNFQCKQLKRKLDEPEAIKELGKIFYYSSRGHYSLPAHYTFVAPHAVGRRVRDLMAHPERLKARVIEQWDAWCANRISDGQTISLDEAIREKIDAFDFSTVDALDASKMLKDLYIRPALVAWFGVDPGEAPRGEAPAEIQAEEASFIRQLVEAYNERCGSSLNGATAALAHAEYGAHLRRQRTRFFDAASFKRYYRDNTPEVYLEGFEDDIYNGVIETHSGSHPDTLERVDKVMAQAAVVHPSGVLAKYARVAVKQGVCHHFANEGRLRWKR